jgi:hypothetical protein
LRHGPAACLIGRAVAATNLGRRPTSRTKSHGHALTIDSGWREVADTALAFVQRFTS